MTTLIQYNSTKTNHLCALILSGSTHRGIQNKAQGLTTKP